jgi:hypothetical protein
MAVDVRQTRQHETVELLPTAIRNQCVNTGAVESRGEVRTSDLIEFFKVRNDFIRKS